MEPNLTWTLSKVTISCGPAIYDAETVARRLRIPAASSHTRIPARY